MSGGFSQQTPKAVLPHAISPQPSFCSSLMICLLRYSCWCQDNPFPGTCGESPPQRDWVLSPCSCHPSPQMLIFPGRWQWGWEWCPWEGRGRGSGTVTYKGTGTRGQSGCMQGRNCREVFCELRSPIMSQKTNFCVKCSVYAHTRARTHIHAHAPHTHACLHSSIWVCWWHVWHLTPWRTSWARVPLSIILSNFLKIIIFGSSLK